MRGYFLILILLAGIALSQTQHEEDVCLAEYSCPLEDVNDPNDCGNADGEDNYHEHFEDPYGDDELVDGEENDEDEDAEEEDDDEVEGEDEDEEEGEDEDEEEGEGALPEYEPIQLNCPSTEDRWITQKFVHWGVENRARLTIPPEVSVESSTPGGEVGVVARTFIAKYTWLGEFQGQIVQRDNLTSVYTWAMRRGPELDYYIDAFNETTSNWLRWVNSARHIREQNVAFKACRGRALYITKRDVYPGQELRVFKGIRYSESLGIDMSYYLDSSVDTDLYRKYACWEIKT